MGRGTLIERAVNTLVDRVIPAWAGNTEGQTLANKVDAGHPRVGGEHLLGKLYAATLPRVIPAWAGNTPIASN